MQSWAILSAKWKAHEYTDMFADVADEHIKSVARTLEEQEQDTLEVQTPKESVFFAAVGGSASKVPSFTERFVNRIYDATDEKNEYGATIYQARDDHNLVIEYRETVKNWVWKERSLLGKGQCHAFEVKPLQGVTADIQTVTEVRFSTGKPAPKHLSDPLTVLVAPIYAPIAPPALPEPPLPSSADVELFWLMCEAILKFPVLAKSDGLIKSKNDLMAVLSNNRNLVQKDIMTRVLTAADVFDLFVNSDLHATKKQRRD
jgi:hypothetical protein